MSLPTEKELQTKVIARNITYRDRIREGAEKMIRRAEDEIEANPAKALRYEEITLGRWDDPKGILMAQCNQASQQEPEYSFNMRQIDYRYEVYVYRRQPK